MTFSNFKANPIRKILCNLQQTHLMLIKFKFNQARIYNIFTYVGSTIIQVGKTSSLHHSIDEPLKKILFRRI